MKVSLKGSLTRDFQLQVFSLGLFQIFSKICRDIRKVMFIIPAINLSPVYNVTREQLSPVTTTAFHGFSVIAGVIDTGDKLVNNYHR